MVIVKVFSEKISESIAYPFNKKLYKTTLLKNLQSNLPASAQIIPEDLLHLLPEALIENYSIHLEIFPETSSIQI
jgi:hypothetical protein